MLQLGRKAKSIESVLLFHLSTKNEGDVFHHRQYHQMNQIQVPWPISIKVTRASITDPYVGHYLHMHTTMKHIVVLPSPLQLIVESKASSILWASSSEGEHHLLQTNTSVQPVAKFDPIFVGSRLIVASFISRCQQHVASSCEGDPPFSRNPPGKICLIVFVKPPRKPPDQVTSASEGDGLSEKASAILSNEMAIELQERFTISAFKDMVKSITSPSEGEEPSSRSLHSASVREGEERLSSFQPHPISICKREEMQQKSAWIEDKQFLESNFDVVAPTSANILVREKEEKEHKIHDNSIDNPIRQTASPSRTFVAAASFCTSVSINDKAETIFCPNRASSKPHPFVRILLCEGDSFDSVCEGEEAKNNAAILLEQFDESNPNAVAAKSNANPQPISVCEGEASAATMASKAMTATTAATAVSA